MKATKRPAQVICTRFKNIHHHQPNWHSLNYSQPTDTISTLASHKNTTRNVIFQFGLAYRFFRWHLLYRRTWPWSSLSTGNRRRHGTESGIVDGRRCHGLIISRTIIRRRIILGCELRPITVRLLSSSFGFELLIMSLNCPGIHHCYIIQVNFWLKLLLLLLLLTLWRTLQNVIQTQKCELKRTFRQYIKKKTKQWIQEFQRNWQFSQHSDNLPW